MTDWRDEYPRQSTQRLTNTSWKGTGNIIVAMLFGMCVIGPALAEIIERFSK